MPLDPKQQPPYYTPGTTTPTTQPSKRYVCQLFQNGTNTPTVNEIYNTIGNIIWTRVSTGQYQATLTGAFPLNKIALATQSSSIITPTPTYNGLTSLNRISDDIMQLTTVNSGLTPTDISTLVGNDNAFTVPQIEIFI